METGKARYSCIGEGYELDIDNQELLINCTKLGGVVLLSFSIVGRELRIVIDPQMGIQLNQNCEVRDKDREQIESLCGPTGVEGPSGGE